MRSTYKITMIAACTGILCGGAVLLLVSLDIPVFFIVGVAAILAGAGGYLAARSVLGPVEALKKAADMINSGNIDYKMELGSSDEFGELSRVLEDMAAKIRAAFPPFPENSADAQEDARITARYSGEGEFYRKIFNNAGNAMFVYDVAGGIIEVNSRACDLTLYSREELVGTVFLDLHAAEERTRSKKAFKIGAQASSVRFESRFLRKDGKEVDVELSTVMVDISRGIVLSIVADISERKGLERALLESEERARTFMDTASDLMYITDREGRVTYMNRAMVQKLGFERNPARAVFLRDIIDEEQLEAYGLIEKEMMGRGEAAYQITWNTGEGSSLEGEVESTAIYDAEGRYAGSRNIFRDITERKKIESAQRLAHLGKLAADVAHEVKTPVTVISGRAELGLAAKAREDVDKNLEIIIDQCGQARSIVERLLKFSKPSREERREADINEMLDIICGLIEPQFMRYDVRIEKKFRSPLPPVRINDKQIQEVFMNLMRNALEAIGEDGSVTIETSEEEGLIRVDFKDTGGGISEKDLKKIFDPFFTTKEKGTGLGLSVCYGIMKAHGGDLFYSSEPGRGTTATVILPVSDKENNGR